MVSLDASLPTADTARLAERSAYVRPALAELHADIQRKQDQLTLDAARRTLWRTRPRRWWLALKGKTPMEFVVDPDHHPIRLKIRGKWE